jgi:hypothetical protein
VILSAPAIAGHEERLRKYASVLRALPAWQAQSPGEDPKDHGIAVRNLSDQSQTYLQIANDTPYSIRLAGLLEAPATASVEDLGRNLRLVPQPVLGGHQLVIDLLPFGVSAIRVGSPRVQITGITPYPSEAVLTSMEAQYQQLSNQLARLNRGPGNAMGEPSNSGFEPLPPSIEPNKQGQEPSPSPSSQAAVPGGWTLEGALGSTIMIDSLSPHSGQGSLKLSAPIAPASVTSGPFVPSGGSGLLIQAHYRADQPGARVRLWIQGESGGQPFVRRSEFEVSSSWESRAVRVNDLPAGGLDAARLRFELSSAGTLWIDDLHIQGDATPKSVRLNAQRTLLAALQAYRAQHYSEFARLASSHWARHPSVVAIGRPNPTAELSGTHDAPRPGPAAASALSPDRRLR